MATQSTVQDAGLPGKDGYSVPEFMQESYQSLRQEGREVETSLPGNRQHHDFTSAIPAWVLLPGLRKLRRPGLGAT